MVAQRAFLYTPIGHFVTLKLFLYIVGYANGLVRIAVFKYECYII